MNLVYGKKLIASLIITTLLTSALHAQTSPFPRTFRLRKPNNPSVTTALARYSSQFAVPAIVPVGTRYTGRMYQQVFAKAQHTHLTEQQNKLLFGRANVSSLKDLPQARFFWHEDAKNLADQVLAYPHQISTNTLNNLIADISGIGIFGSQEEDVPFLLRLHQQLISTSAAPYLTTAVARALLRLNAYEAVRQLAYTTPGNTELWQEINTYIQQHQLPCQPLEFQEETSNKVSHKQSLDRRIVFRAEDPSAGTTSWYMQLGDDFVLQPPDEQSLLPRTPLPETPPLQILPSIHEPTELFLAPPNTPFNRLLNSQLLTTPNPSHRIPLAPNKPGFSLTISSPAATAADSTWWQRAGLYMSSFVVGLEIGQPIIATLGETFQLSLSKNILVSAATFLPYSLGAFGADWIKRKMGKKACLNTGLALAGSSFLAGSQLLGLNGHFALWNHPDAQFYSILGTISLASWGGTLIHSSLGPIMRELSQNTTELRRNKRIAFTETGEATGLLASYFFPLISTEVMGLDWSAPFLLAWPLVTMAAIGVNTSRLPNFKMNLQNSLSNRGQKNWKQKFTSNSYVELIKTDKSASQLLKGLLLLNGIELSLNSGFLLMLPSLTQSSSSQYLLGLAQFAAPYVIGSYLGTKLLEWFPNRNMTAASVVAAVGGIGALFSTHDVYALTAALSTAELGLSAAYTLSFTKAAKKPQTQDRMTSLILASVVTAAVGPYLLTQVAQAMINMNLFTESTATALALIGIPGLLTLWLLRTVKKLEIKNPVSFQNQVKSWFNHRRFH
ncbi:MAG: MFS transporter [Elusimicrobiaceae bacterium]|nr:MFS transporter [Elusimicrobiaceae bacterium]